jgi:hypothetical protein
MSEKPNTCIFALFEKNGSVLLTLEEIERRGWRLKSWTRKTRSVPRGRPVCAELAAAIADQPYIYGLDPASRETVPGRACRHPRTRHVNRLAQGEFLLSDEVAGQTTKLRNGRAVVTPAGQHVPLKVQSGLIHDWTGAAFIPNAKLDDVLPVFRDYDRYKDYYRPLT